MSSEATFPNLVVPKPSITPEAAASNSADAKTNGEAAAADATPKKTPAKRKATPKKAAVKKEENGDEPEEPTTPKPAKKRTPKPKKEKEVKSEAKVESDGKNGDAAEPSTSPAAASSSKKRGAKAKATGDETETPTKKRKTKAAANGDAETPVKTPKTPKAAATPKAKSTKFPESFEEFSDGDKLLVRMRKEGKGWEEIEKAWTAVTGQVPGKDVLRKKETKLRALAVEWKAGDARKLAQFKVTVEAELAAAFKKLEAEKWIKMAEMFKAAGSEYSSPGLQKKWEMMVKKGEVDPKGNYVGGDAEVSEAAEASGSGDAEVEEENGDVEVEEENGDAENEDGSEEVAENEEA